MLVVNAVAIAGGVYRPPRTSDWGFERDAITGRGDLRLASVRRDELKARELRLKAEADGLETFPPLPADMSPGAQPRRPEHGLDRGPGRLHHLGTRAVAYDWIDKVTSVR